MWKASTSPSTTARPWPSWISVCSLHSIATGLSAIRGGATWLLFAVLRPASASSFTPAGKSIAVTFMASAVRSVTRLTTNSRARRMFSPVSFSPSRFGPMPMATTGGEPLIALKKL